ncbi:Acetyl-/propionyl-coenzyme A carboxylase alpha chain [Alphaproteobacteria bacterium SO-S41]|nr:Acetyl-/propionyl-coenzyme A carboxylase alpha chain [Alphaproteobacteria bacterium SO-S41]
MFPSVLVANRGEIARRVMRTARRLGLRTIAVYSDADRDAWHVADADEAVHIGGSAAKDSYLRIDAIIEAARQTGAAAIHPGYGFLSEKAEFADACAAAGIAFIGPPASAIRAMGLKDAAKDIVGKAGVPVVPGYQGDDQSTERLQAEAGRTGYPVLIKAVAGGGGKGMRRVDAEAEFVKALEGAKREAMAAFGDDRVLIEKYVTRPRHIEIQVFADAHGNAVHLFERDCSLQRRHQKVIEEAPAPGMPEAMRAAMGDAAVKAALAIGYRGAGTIEFIVDSSEGLRPDGFFFMEMNTRLQVEHPVTEAITGLDLVELQLRIAAGEALPPQSAITLCGHAVEARLYAEDPAKNFLPSIGTLRRLHLPAAGDGVRIDAGVREGDAVTMFYDPMIAKVVAHGTTRDEARQKLARVMEEVEVAGVRTNAAFVAKCLRHPGFASGDIDTGFIDRHMKELAPKPGAASGETLALAAVATLLESAGKADAASPWAVEDGFRLGGAGFDLVEFVSGDETIGVRVTRPAGGWRVEVGGAAFDGALRLNGNRLTGSLGGRSVHAWVERAGNTVTLIRDGETRVLALFDPFDVDDTAADTGSTVLSPMPGKIVQVLAEPGQQVKRGAALAVLEAMKMEHTLTAPADRKIAEVPVSVGDQVTEGSVIIRFAEA